MRILCASFWVALAVIQSCSPNRSAGKSVVDETTNGLHAVVLKADGSPAAEARVSIYPSWYVKGMSGTANRVVITDKNGNFELDSLGVGDYWIEVEQGNSGLRMPLHRGLNDSVKVQTWTLSSLGALTGHAVPNAIVRVYGSQRATQVNAAGDFVLDSLPPGEFGIRVDAYGVADSLLGEALVTVVAAQTVSAGNVDSLRFDPTTWKQSLRIIIPPDTGALTDTLQNFLVPVRLDVNTFADIQAIRGLQDVRIADAHYQELSYTVDEWNPSANIGVLWANLAVAHPRAGDTLYVIWDKPGLAAAQLLPSLRSDSVYGIWHFAEADPLAEATDLGTRIYADSGTVAAQGFVGFGRQFFGHNQMAIEPPAYQNILAGFTISCWVRLDSTQFNFAKIFDLGTSGPPFGTILIDIDTTTHTPAFQMAFVDSTYKRIVSKGASQGWTYLAVMWNGAQMSFYRDGVLQGRLAVSALPFDYTGHPLLLGNQEDDLAGLIGVLDDFHFELRERSAAWIRHSYLTQYHAN